MMVMSEETAIKCTQCGYDLRGNLGGRIVTCPECGLQQWVTAHRAIRRRREYIVKYVGLSMLPCVVNLIIACVGGSVQHGPYFEVAAAFMGIVWLLSIPALIIFAFCLARHLYPKMPSAGRTVVTIAMTIALMTANVVIYGLGMMALLIVGVIPFRQ